MGGASGRPPEIVNRRHRRRIGGDLRPDAPPISLLGPTYYAGVIVPIIDTGVANEPSLLVVGASARAAAVSARLAGYRPYCADLFADLDTRRVAGRALRCPPNDYPEGLVPLVASLPSAPLLVTGGLEARPDLLERLHARRPLAGGPPSAVAAAADPLALPGIADGIDGVAVPDTRAAPPAALSGPYLVKPRRGTGGKGVRPWAPGETPPGDRVLQRRIAGRAIGVVGLATERGAAVWGVTEQSLAPGGFGYRGSVGPIDPGPRAGEGLAALVRRVAARFGLRGPFGLDAILDDAGTAWIVEINPRYPASLEVLERAAGRPALPPADPAAAHAAGPAPGRCPVWGKRVVFADVARVAGPAPSGKTAWRFADVPEPGTRIPAGRPVCTVFARATTAEAVRSALAARERRALAALFPRAGP